jgi:hypothetical protein
MAGKQHASPHVVGWREVVSFPEWGVRGIEAKVDTGANTSAIHVEDVKRLPGDRVRFHLVVNRRKPFKHVPVTADITRTTRVRSSTGHVQERFVVTTVMRLGPIRRHVELSLVGRDKMLCRMLLGRKALHGVLVDVTRRNLLGRPLKKKPTPTKERHP